MLLACQPAPTIQHQPASLASLPVLSSISLLPLLYLSGESGSLHKSAWQPLLEKEAKQEESQLPGVRNVLTCWRGQT